MAEQTNISWCDHTFNPWVGCMKVGPACDGCYAEALMSTTGRMKRVEWGAPGKGVGARSRTTHSYWRQPLAWDRKAAAAGTRPFVFCASLADVFDSAVPTEWRRDLFDLIRATPHLTWLLLTKRPQNIARLFAETITPELRKAHQGVEHLGKSLWPSNAAIGCTVVTQEEADRDVPVLLAAKAGLKPAFAFLSMEPLLAPVDLRHLRRPHSTLDALTGQEADELGSCGWSSGIDWVITGGETDQGPHKARPSHPDWFRSLRDQCAAANVAFHHKQNGEWAPCRANDGGWRPVGEAGFTRIEPNGEQTYDGWPMQKVGKKAAGRLLDGVLHDARPGGR